MRTLKFSDEAILKQLNADWDALDGDVICIREYGGDGFDAINATHSDWDECLASTGGLIEVSKEVSTISPEDLQDDPEFLELNDSRFEEYLVACLGPYTEGDWEFSDIFNTEQPTLLEGLRNTLHSAALNYVKAYPKVLADGSGFFKINKTSIFKKGSDGKFRKATADEIRAADREGAEYAAEVARRDEIRARLLSRMTPEEREILGV